MGIGCPEVLAVNILNKHLTGLSKSLSDPVSVARLLYGEHVIIQQKLNGVEDDNLSLSDKRKILLAAVKDAVQASHVNLQKFSIVLCHLTRNVKLGESILRDYSKLMPTLSYFFKFAIGIYFSSDEETVMIKVEDGTSNNYCTICAQNHFHNLHLDEIFVSKYSHSYHVLLVIMIKKLLQKLIFFDYLILHRIGVKCITTMILIVIFLFV